MPSNRFDSDSLSCRDVGFAQDRLGPQYCIRLDSALLPKTTVLRHDVGTTFLHCVRASARVGLAWAPAFAIASVLHWATTTYTMETDDDLVLATRSKSISPTLAPNDLALSATGLMRQKKD